MLVRPSAIYQRFEIRNARTFKTGWGVMECIRGLGPRGRSSNLRIPTNGLWRSLESATLWGSEGREFESHQSDHSSVV